MPAISSDPIAAYAARHTGSTLRSPEQVAASAREFRSADECDRDRCEALSLELGFWMAAYRDLHKAASELARTLASHREEVQIDNTVYAITGDPDDTGSVTLEKKFCRDATPRTVSGGFADDCLTAGENVGYSCDCPDFTHRHAGTGSPGCRHIRALAAFGRLPERGDAIDALGIDDSPWADHVHAESAALAARFNR